MCVCKIQEVFTSDVHNVSYVFSLLLIHPPPTLIGNKDNPFVVRPSYHNWAPWIGPHTRCGNVVLNTEFRKMHAPRSPAEELELNLTEDRLADELLKVKVWKQSVAIMALNKMNRLFIVI